ncbi:MAG: hypothetical protein JNM27_16850 [Leptospirales bacterium]|nr:hypothetical protein [Leptospirales bacterium]
MLVHEFLRLGIGGWAIENPFAELTVAPAREGYYVRLGLPGIEGWRTMTQVRKISNRTFELSDGEISICLTFPDAMRLEIARLTPKPAGWNPEWRIFSIKKNH